MAIVSSQGTLTVANAAPLQVSNVSTSGPFFDGYRRTYGQIYRTQPSVRTVIDFFARNIAQLGLHAFLRVSDTDRQRLTDHPLPRTIERPNYATTRYRFFESTVQDIGIYANGYWWKQRRGDTLSGLVRLPSAEVSVKGGLLPSAYIWTPANGLEPKTFDPNDIVHFRFFDPSDPLVGFPMLETLRTILAEEAAAGAYRRAFWKNGARTETVILRPATAPKEWDKQGFRKSWQDFAGSGPHAGATPILEDGMDVKTISQNFRDSEYLGARKLTREEVAAAYHVPLPMVGILEHATFSNIKEQHKQLYQDCLGPWLTMLQEEIELQLLPEFDGVDNVYLEFNIAEKMKGSFEEQASSLTQAVGRPYMTANEARARLNLPSHDNPTADDLADVAPGQGQAFGGDRQPADQATAQSLRTALEAFVPRQVARLQKDAADERAAKFNHARWSRELAADIRSAGGPSFTSVWGEDADRVASIINSETWSLLEDGHAPWPGGRVDSVIARFGDLHG
jgi:HK97 family phage portal protein